MAENAISINLIQIGIRKYIYAVEEPMTSAQMQAFLLMSREEVHFVDDDSRDGGPFVYEGTIMVLDDGWFSVAEGDEGLMLEPTERDNDLLVADAYRPSASSPVSANTGASA